MIEAKKEGDEMRIIKIIIIIFFLGSININSYSEELNNCLNIKNMAKKIVCKTKTKAKEVSSKINSVTEGITSKKTLADFFKKEKK